eukprot:PITA_25318
MLVGAYPSEDPDDPTNFKKTIGRILGVQYTIPDYVHVSAECHRLLSRIFVADPDKRITIPEIRNHEWFLKNLPAALVDAADTISNESDDPDQPTQSIDEIMRIIAEDRILAPGSGLGQYFGDSFELDDMDLENDGDLDVDSSGEFVCAL